MLAQRQKVIVETYDSKGNPVKTFKQGDKKITQTIISTGAVINRKFNVDTIDKDSIVIQVFKTKYRLYVYHKGRFLTAYKCVFGPNLLPKLMEGDRKTPEGWFTIQSIVNHKTWSKFLLIDYPTDISKAIFDSAKIKKIIPSNARIGGSVGIHGIWQGGDNVIDMKHNWTDGCISLKNNDVEELAKIVQKGTRILIKK